MPNPVIPGFYADPELHFFEGRYWLYPTTSTAYEDQTSFRAFSSPDLSEWKDEGVILDIAKLAWGKGHAAWAPSCAFKNGLYYFYFSVGDGDGLGVATSSSPGGPFVDALGKPLVSEYCHGAQPIDAHCFIDDDGQAYLYWGGWSKAVAAPLSDDMLSVGEVREITPERYVEGPFMLKRDGTYYFMWSEGSWGDETYNVGWARSNSPYGPFVREGQLFLRSDLASSAGHHSMLELADGRWLVAYHRRPAGITARDSRVVCIDEVSFDAEGRIMPLTMT